MLTGVLGVRHAARSALLREKRSVKPERLHDETLYRLGLALHSPMLIRAGFRPVRQLSDY